MPLATAASAYARRRAARKGKDAGSLDMNLVALIDIFTILIFFLLSSAAGVELLPSTKAVKLPESVSQAAPKETITITVSGSEIVVDGRRVASVIDALATDGDLIAPLKAELDALRQRAPTPTLAADGSTPSAPAITILGDKDVPYRLLRKVMATAAQAQFRDVSFAVTRKALS
jgi:biopolymer transport protein TolR